MAFKPYVKKPLFHSERGETVLANIHGYIIRVGKSEVRTKEAGQCIAAIRAARDANRPCLVFAIGEAYGIDTLEVVDEDFLLTKIGGSDANPS